MNLNYERTCEQVYEKCEQDLDLDPRETLNEIKYIDQKVIDWFWASPELIKAFIKIKRPELLEQLYDQRIDRALYDGPEYDSERDIMQ